MYLEEALPDILQDQKQQSLDDIYVSVYLLVNYTRGNIVKGNLTAVKKCFKIADKLYSKGNRIVRSALENVYVFSFSSFPVRDTSEAKQIMGLIPLTLYSVYLKQVLHHGC
jgi:hypothetical protein